ncbi:MAG TPA: HAD hydrolase-like protein, partial [Acidimicrobiales bacterium]|nr:HAD hydrolase-like protein [Acidimicrobiales bacterium]
ATTTWVRRLAARAERTRAPIARASCSSIPLLPSLEREERRSSKHDTATGREGWQTAPMPAPSDPQAEPCLLVLWDVDHTLIETRGVGRAIYDRAFPAATGKPLAELASVSGRTELDIMTETLRINDIQPTDDMVTKLAGALIQGYEDARDELRTTGRALPGALDALASLADDPVFHQSVLTGNLREVARIKLEVFELNAYLDLASGAYGDDHSDRSKLIAVAQRRADERTGTVFGSNDTVLVGDTSRDVQAGLAAGVRVIGVATGKTGIQELHRAGAHEVANTLEECRDILKRLGRTRDRELSSDGGPASMTGGSG